MNQDLDQIDNDIAAKHLLKHPFYLAWTRGELSREALADYAQQYYQHVAAFPVSLHISRPHPLEVFTSLIQGHFLFGHTVPQ